MAAVGPDQLDVDGVIYNVSQIFYNGTVFNASSCTPETCSLLIGTYRYLPSLPGNAFFAAIFSLLLVVNVPLGIYYRTWGVMVGMVFGLALEVAGYVGRILIHNNDFSRNPFLIYIYCVTLGPALISAAIYLCLARIVVVYGEGNSRFKPRTYSISFMAGDFLSLAVQGAGGGMAVVTSEPTISNDGVHVMIAGLVCQVISLTLFAIVCADFAWCVYRGKGISNPSFDDLRRSRKWTGFLVALAIATVAIYARSVYRIAELQAGFHSDLANQEALFMVLEGSVITIATIGLTAFHPGLVFGRQWRDAKFTLKGSTPPKDALSNSHANVETGQEEYVTKQVGSGFHSHA